VSSAGWIDSDPSLGSSLRAIFRASFMARLSRSLLSRVSFALVVFRFELDPTQIT
jgi:hypothetical protein